MKTVKYIWETNVEKNRVRGRPRDDSDIAVTKAVLEWKDNT